MWIGPMVLRSWNMNRHNFISQIKLPDPQDITFKAYNDALATIYKVEDKIDDVIASIGKDHGIYIYDITFKHAHSQIFFDLIDVNTKSKLKYSLSLSIYDVIKMKPIELSEIILLLFYKEQLNYKTIHKTSAQFEVIMDEYDPF